MYVCGSSSHFIISNLYARWFFFRLALLLSACTWTFSYMNNFWDIPCMMMDKKITEYVDDVCMLRGVKNIQKKNLFLSCIRNWKPDLHRLMSYEVSEASETERMRWMGKVRMKYWSPWKKFIHFLTLLTDWHS